MAQNIFQVYQNNPITSNVSTDLMYFGRSPYGSNDDAAMLYSSFAAQFAPVGSGVLSITGTPNQVFANGLSGTPETGSVTLTLPQDIGTSSTPLFAAISVSFVKDNIGQNILQFASLPGSTNWISLINGVAGVGPLFAAVGTDADINIYLKTKGTGFLVFDSESTTNPITFNTGTSFQHSTVFNFANTATSRIVTFPDATGTVAFTSDIPSFPLSLANGGTGQSLVAVNNAVFSTTGGGAAQLSTTLPNGLAATNMNLTTPTLGVATATSINFGGSTLNTYTQAQTWMPVVTFATPGDVSVVYGIQLGLYSRIGNIVNLHFDLQATPTFTTASGNLKITGLPFSPNAASNAVGSVFIQSPAFPTGTSSLFLFITAGTTFALVAAAGTTVAAANFTTTECTSGNTLFIQGSITYLV